MKCLKWWQYIESALFLSNENFEIGLREQFFPRQEFSFKKFDFKKRFKTEIEEISEKICSRFNDTVSHKIDFTVLNSHRDHPLAWKLRCFFLIFIRLKPTFGLGRLEESGIVKGIEWLQSSLISSPRRARNYSQKPRMQKSLSAW